MKYQINEILLAMISKRASDLHLTAGVPPVYRIDGEMKPVRGPILSPAETEALIKPLLSEEQYVKFMNTGEADFAYALEGKARFRVNVFKQKGCISAVFRIIPATILKLEDLGMPRIVGELAKEHQGLIIVTGPTGSGKSTTLAAMIDVINRTMSKHIITLEDPIEFLHSHKRSIVNQREVGSDTASFAKGLRASLREDPDVILIGEMRDLETIQIAIRAAETGHLVFATLHTPGAPETVERILDVFPPHQQRQISVQLASCLKGVIFQKLLPKQGGGRVAALEILIVTPAVRNLIREGKTHQLPSVMQTGGRFGMRTMEFSLTELRRNNLISNEIYKQHTEISGL